MSYRKGRMSWSKARYAAWRFRAVLAFLLGAVVMGLACWWCR